jgi:hypothetical protein
VNIVSLEKIKSLGLIRINTYFFARIHSNCKVLLRQQKTAATATVTNFYIKKDREQGTGNREQGTGNRGQGTGDREQGTGNREQGTGNRVEGGWCFFHWLRACNRAS